jgi:hypothetical protein
MRLEQIPVLLGVLVALVGAGLVVDAWLAETALVSRERRRRTRAERHRFGEALVGGGLICMAAALAGGDAWRYATLAILVGAFLLITGSVLNRRYLREVLTFRGPARRADGPAGERGGGTPAGEAGAGHARRRRGPAAQPDAAVPGGRTPPGESGAHKVSGASGTSEQLGLR